MFCAPCVGVDVCEGTGVGVTCLVSIGLDERVVAQSFKWSLGHVVSHLDLLYVMYDLNTIESSRPVVGKVVWCHDFVYVNLNGRVISFTNRSWYIGDNNRDI